MGQLMITLSKDFLLLVAIALLLAIPLAVLGMRVWLNNFVYKTAISFDVFLVAGGTVVLLALFTMSFHIISASRTNPATVLKSE